MFGWVPEAVALDLLHRLVPAALDEDLLQDHLSQRVREEGDSISFGWQCWPLDVSPALEQVSALGVSDWPALGIVWEVAEVPAADPAVKDDEPWHLTPRQQMALLADVLGAVVIAERLAPTQTLRLG